MMANSSSSSRPALGRPVLAETVRFQPNLPVYPSAMCRVHMTCQVTHLGPLFGVVHVPLGPLSLPATARHGGVQ
jgi:hypothetical protein